VLKIGGWEPLARSMLRMVVGFTFSLHGFQKLLGLFGGMGGRGATAPLFLDGDCGSARNVWRTVARGWPLYASRGVCIGRRDGFRLLSRPSTARALADSEWLLTCGAVLLRLSLPLYRGAGASEFGSSFPKVSAVSTTAIDAAVPIWVPLVVFFTETIAHQDRVNELLGSYFCGIPKTSRPGLMSQSGTTMHHVDGKLLPAFDVFGDP
jgi:hypothetical protein